MPPTAYNKRRRLYAGSTKDAREVHCVISSTEHNYLLNPEHPEFDRIRMADPELFLFDRRMWKTGAA
jgi:hypothetical protein